MTETNRRVAIGLGFALTAAPVLAAGQDDAASAEAALRAFLRSFANCDLPAMEAAFAPHATSFDALTASAGSALPAKDSMKRHPGMPPTMRRLAEQLPKARPGPPYHRPDLIDDLQVQVVGDVAICSFHFDSPNRLGRRSIVLVRQGSIWRILHLHASNLQL